MTLAPVAQPDNCPTCGHPIPPATELRHDAASRILIAGSRAMHFPPAHHQVLALLLDRFGHTVQYDPLITAAYNLDEPDDALKSLNMIILKIRRRLEGSGLAIVNHFEAGYALVNETAARIYEARKAA